MSVSSVTEKLDEVTGCKRPQQREIEREREMWNMQVIKANL